MPAPGGQSPLHVGWCAVLAALVAVHLLMAQPPPPAIALPVTAPLPLRAALHAHATPLRGAPSSAPHRTNIHPAPPRMAGSDSPWRVAGSSPANHLTIPKAVTSSPLFAKALAGLGLTGLLWAALCRRAHRPDVWHAMTAAAGETDASGARSTKSQSFLSGLETFLDDPDEEPTEAEAPLSPSQGATAIAVAVFPAPLPLSQLEPALPAAEPLPPPEPVDLSLEDVAGRWLKCALKKRKLGSSDPALTQDLLTFELNRGPDGTQPLGLDLQEFAPGVTDDRGLVLVAEVIQGGAAAALGTEGLRPGDTIVGVGADRENPIDVEGRNLATFLAALQQQAGQPRLVLWVKRLVARAQVQVRIVNPFVSEADSVTELQVPAGRKLETALIEAGISKPSGRSMTCGGGGICGTCAVRVIQGKELLTPPSPREYARTGPYVRLACQARVGYGNRTGTLDVRLLHKQV